MDMAGETDPTGTPPSPPPPPAPNTGFTQEQINDAAGRARNEGRQSAQKDLLESLGVKDVDEAKAILAAKREADEKNKDELTKAADKATKAEADLIRVTADHESASHNNRVQAAVLKKLLGEQATVLDKANVIRKLIDVDAKAEDKDLDAAVEALAKTMPELFSVVGAGQGGDGNGGTGGKPPGRPATPPGRPAPGGGSGAATPADAARTKLYERHPRLNKK
jgi:2-oxoglutarate dehydrogenase complex dehydrogenase (E1) component-like enzyme